MKILHTINYTVKADPAETLDRVQLEHQFVSLFPDAEEIRVKRVKMGKLFNVVVILDETNGIIGVTGKKEKKRIKRKPLK